jgi:hypothetical protein
MWGVRITNFRLLCLLLKSISSGAQYVTLQIYFSHQSLVIYFCPTPHIKLKLGLQIGCRVLIANHLDQSLWLANQKQGAAVRSYLLHCSLAGVRLCCAFYQPQQTVQKCWAKTIMTCLHPILQCHILSTSGVALLNPALYHESVMAWMDLTWDSHWLTSCFLQGTLTFKDRQLRKFFKTGDHVKVIAGKHEGATGMIVKIKNNVITLLSDTTREDVSTSTLWVVSKLITDSQERMKKIEL